MKFFITAILFLLTMASSAWAGPLETKRVPADAKWLVHVDFDALRESALGQQLSKDLFSGKWADAKFKRMQKELGIDASTDMQGVTLFDTRFQRHHGLMMIRCGNLHPQQIVEGLTERHPEVAKSDYRGHQLVTWTRGAGKRYEHEVIGCFHGSDTLLISRDIDVLKRTLEVLDGTSESVSADSPLAGATSSGTIMTIRSKGLVMHELPFRSSLMRQSKRFAMSVGESNGEVFLNAEVATKTADAAENLGKIIEGFRAMGLVRHDSDEAGKRIFDGLAVTVNDTLVEANWKMSPEDAQKMMAAMKKHRQQRHHRHRHHQHRWQRGKQAKEKESKSAPEESNGAESAETDTDKDS